MAKRKSTKDKRSTKHTYKAKDRVTKNQGGRGEIKCSGKVSSSFIIHFVLNLTLILELWNTLVYICILKKRWMPSLSDADMETQILLH